MTTLTERPDTTTSPPDEGPDGWLLVRRVTIVGLSSLAAVALLVVFLAWLALQIDWEVPDPGALSGPTELVSADGTVIARFDSEVDRRIVSLDQMSPHIKDAVVALEDARFYEHEGVDPLSLLRAVVTNLRTGDIRQGGSTLTQQYVKNAFTGAEQTITRKVREAVISIALEKNATKDQILERYLNTVYFGEGAYGVEAAALTYFGKPAAKLSLAESATLAQLLPAPSLRNPRADPGLAEERRNDALERMADLGMISRSEASAAKEDPLEVQPRKGRSFRAPYFVEYVRRQIVATYGRQALLTGALRVETTLDLAAQKQLDAAVAEHLYEKDDTGVAAGAVAVDPTTGAILAIHGGPSFQEQQLDLGTQLSIRQPGSTFKPFAFIAALEDGVEPDDRYPAPETVTEAEGCGTFKKPVGNAAGRGYGELPLDDALANSVNTVMVQVGCEAGPADVRDVADRLGVRNELTDEPLIAIGGVAKGPSPLDMASAFGTLANDGVHCPAHAIARVLGPDGKEIERPQEVVLSTGRPRAHGEDELAELFPGGFETEEVEGRCYRTVDPDITRTTTAVLERVVDETTGRRADIGRPQAGKTGTTNDEADAWFAGYTPALSLAIWVGDPSEPRPLHDVAGFSKVQGGTIPALIWRSAAAEILADVDPTDFLEPGESSDEERVRVAPARPRSSPTPKPSPTPTPSPSPTSQPSPSPSESETDDGPLDGGGDDDDDDCIPLVSC